MALTANQTSPLEATGDWQQISLAGEVKIDCDDQFRDALMADQATTPTVLGHIRKKSDIFVTDSGSEWNVPANGSCWVRARSGANFTITSVNPVT